MKPADTTRLIAIYDAHIGRERAHVRGAEVTRTIHDPIALRAMLRFAQDWKPKIVVLGGDQLDCACISHFNEARPGNTEGFRLKEDLDTLDRLLIKPFDDLIPKDGRKIFLTGNHERRVDDHLEKFPALKGLVSIASYLKLKERNWEVFSLGELAKVHKVYYLHGESISSGVYSAKKALEMFGRNLRFGHRHSWQTYVQTSALDVNDFHSAIQVPGMCHRNPSYAPGRPNQWLQGFLAEEFHPSGHFSSQVHIMVRGAFTANGKLYTGR